MSGDPHKEYDFGAELDGLKADEWTPHAPGNDQAKQKPNLDQVREIAEKEGFTSREPKAPQKKEPEGQITIRAKQSVIDEFRGLSASQSPKWPLGYTLERALAALKRELEG